MPGTTARARLDGWAERLHASSYYSFGWLRSPRILVLQRTAERYPSLQTVAQETRRVIVSFPSGRSRSLVVDMRRAPPTNDPGFEDAMRNLRMVVAQRVERVILLVATASGAMQITRLQRAEGTTFFTTLDAQDALRLAAED